MSVQSFEPDEKGFIKQVFLENDVEKGLQKVEDVTTGLTDEVNTIMRSVNDILSLPPLDPEEVLYNVQRGKKKARETTEQLYELDNSQTKALESIEKELTTMKNYVFELEGKIRNGDVSISNYDIKSVQGIPAYKKMLDSVTPEGKTADKLVTGDKQHSENKLQKADPSVESPVAFDVTAPYSTPGNLIDRGVEAKAFYDTSRKVRDGLSIVRYETKSGEIKYRVSKPESIGLKPAKNGRSTKIFSENYIKSELKKGNKHAFAKQIKVGSGAINALKTKTGWAGVALSTGTNIYENISEDEDVSKIVGDAGVDVGIGAISLAAGGAVAAVVVAGAPVLVGAAAALGVSTLASFVFGGIKIGKGKNKKSISDHIKGGVQTIAGWFK